MGLKKISSPSGGLNISIFGVSRLLRLAGCSKITITHAFPKQPVRHLKFHLDMFKKHLFSGEMIRCRRLQIFRSYHRYKCDDIPTDDLWPFCDMFTTNSTILNVTAGWAVSQVSHLSFSCISLENPHGSDREQEYTCVSVYIWIPDREARLIRDGFDAKCDTCATLFACHGLAPGIEINQDCGKSSSNFPVFICFLFFLRAFFLQINILFFEGKCNVWNWSQYCLC